MAMFIRKEVEHQERLEAAGHRSPTWRVLRALKSLFSATQLQGESVVAAQDTQSVARQTDIYDRVCVRKHSAGGRVTEHPAPDVSWA
jgi:hypothetical protein